MIDTNVEFVEKELQETALIFKNGADFNVRHRLTESAGKLVNTVTVNGKTYAYGNLVHIPENDRGDLIRKRLIKRYAKLSVYKAISALTGESSPWGALTGIRPTRLAYNQINETGEFAEFFTDTMKVSDKKTALVGDVIKAQKDFYQKDADNTDFFVFIPFCPSRCKYCSFITEDVKSAEKYVDLYVDALIEDINYSKKFIKKLRSIYVGGGTPVALKDEQLDRVLSAIDDIAGDVEYTVEAGRPDRITESNLRILKSHGVTRICINPQTFCDNTLKEIGRNHSSQDIIRAFNMAKDHFDVNMDLIAGLGSESLEDFKKTIYKTIELSPDDITVHTLCIKRGSSLKKETDRIEKDQIEQMVEYANETLYKNGYLPYYLYRQKYMAGNLENVGYSKPNKQCVYNIDTMEEIANTVACGANAISKIINFNEDRIERYAPPKDVKTYVEKIEEIKSKKDKFFC